jgi:hypothetical protein
LTGIIPYFSKKRNEYGYHKKAEWDRIGEAPLELEMAIAILISNLVICQEKNERLLERIESRSTQQKNRFPD